MPREHEFRPAWSATLLAFGKWLMVGIVLLLVALVLLGVGLTKVAHIFSLSGAMLAAAAMLGGFLMRARVRYGLSETHAWARVGLLGYREVRVPRNTLQHTTCVRSVAARLLSTGDITLWTAGSASPALRFRWIENPERVLDLLTQASKASVAADERAGQAELPQLAVGTSTGTLAFPASSSRAASPFLVIGLVGSIGAGKSEAARVLAAQGCVVIDADKLAKDALLRTEVKQQLTQWWGSEVLNALGEVDRSKLASIIFSDSIKRAQLEALVHPIVHADRAAAIDAARDAGKPGVVIDAPLLFEAGTERFCDRVLCIDAPRDQRLHRVVSTRGWTDAQLASREAAQLSIEEKQRRSDATIMNDGTKEQLQRAVMGQWEAWSGRHA